MVRSFLKIATSCTRSVQFRVLVGVKLTSELLLAAMAESEVLGLADVGVASRLADLCCRRRSFLASATSFGDVTDDDGAMVNLRRMTRDCEFKVS